MEPRLKNKVAIVTGGGAGIGEAISKKFALEGARVLVCGMPDDPIDAVVKEITSKGGLAVAYKGDISLAEHARLCVDTAVKTWGKLDILINNAGVFPVMSTIQDYPIDAFEYLVKNNIYSVFMMTRFAIPYLQQTKGCVVSAGSESGLIGIAENTPYGGTKGFIHSFTKGLAAEQAQFGVRVNAVCPGAIDTAWTHKETGPMSAKNEKMIIEATPMGRRGTPEEVANVYLFLASDEASFVTGSLYSVDGGVTINKGATGSMADKSMKAEPAGELNLKHSKEGDTAKDRYNKVYNSSQKASAPESSGSGGDKLVKTITKTLVGVSVGIAAAKAILNASKNSTPEGQQTSPETKPKTKATTPTLQPDEPLVEANTDPTIPAAKPVNTPLTEAKTDPTIPASKPKSAGAGSKNKGWTKKMDEKKNTDNTQTGGSPGNKGFTNEAATGNTD
ncbi:glucose 1-dehydrogenase [Rhodocytophaga rosea]|uniref:Glucose 1-dehydrogenase n=1 Tax=Rhodocytophaga rosea TaxID=2704465 RepID=A0A6C0GKQ2_9BACT|nr:SDR family oxidoreductase [Rhodocytophaga rosea]QHT68243.1 glucose 1-dehydrogenase [Rhodocytophaga rosea]